MQQGVVSSIKWMVARNLKIGLLDQGIDPDHLTSQIAVAFEEVDENWAKYEHQYDRSVADLEAVKEEFNLSQESFSAAEHEIREVTAEQILFDVTISLCEQLNPTVN